MLKTEPPAVAARFFLLLAACSLPLQAQTTLEVFAIQGAGLVSPYSGQTVQTLDNVVTGKDHLGFFLQTPDGRADADAATSNGIYVFLNGTPMVEVGDQVDVTGKVGEFLGMTQIENPTFTIDSSGNPLPAAALLNASIPSPSQPLPPTDLERYEGMLVRVENGTITGPNDLHNGDFAVVTGPLRALREPGIELPGLPGLPVWDGNPEIFEIDPNRAGLPNVLVRSGARITAEGPLTFTFGDYQMWPTSMTVEDGEPRVEPVRDRAPGELTIASQNLLRFYDDVDDPALDEPVLTTLEYATRLQKASLLIRQALGAPDVLAVQDIENLTTLQDLAARIQADDPAVVYTAHLLPGNDGMGVDVGYLLRDTIRVDSLTQFGKNELLAIGGPPSLLYERPPLVLRGAYVGNGAPLPFVVIGVQLRNQAGLTISRNRLRRFEQARRLAQYIQGLQVSEPGIHLVVTGDFNAFEFTDGYVDVLGQLTGSLDPAGALLPGTDEIDPDLTNQLFLEAPGERYSFVLEGTAQALDHALTSQALAPYVRGLDHARANADAPFSLQTNPATALRTAERDGLALFLMSDSDADGVPEDIDRCPGTAIPEPVPTQGLKPNHWALVNGDGIFDTAGTPASPFTVQQTGGCSCEQIIAGLGLGDGQRKHGCSVGTMKDWIAQVPGKG